MTDQTDPRPDPAPGADKVPPTAAQLDARVSALEARELPGLLGSPTAQAPSGANEPDALDELFS